jgi:serine phosphatase RsbU (regulator of sigma subunit)
MTALGGLLPDRLPDVPGVELAASHLPVGEGGEAGGDWYDVVPLPGGGLVASIGDVVGRGRPATELTARLRRALRAYALEGCGPGEVLRRLNTLVTDTRREMTTLLVLELTPSSGELRAASAGHPPVMVRRAGGGVERWDAARSMPLGVVRDSSYGEDAMRLSPGDAALVFTDGLIERPGLPIEWALDRLEHTIPVSGSADQLRTAVLDRMLAGEDHDDDVAVLVLALPA